jgi:hypothetical protein
MAIWKDYVERHSRDASTKAELGSLGVIWGELPPGATPREVGLHESLPEPLRQAALRLKPFEISPPVRSERGVHLLLATSHNPALDVPLDDVREQIRARLVKRKRDAARAELIARLQREAKVEVNEQAIALLPPPAPPKRLPKAGGAGDGNDHGDGHDHGAPAAPAAGGR